jgi:chromosome segregation ATPase
MFASAYNTIKEILAIVGGVGAVMGTIFGIWFALKRRKENEKKEQQQDEHATKAQLNGVTSKTERLCADVQEFRNAIKTLTTEVHDIQVRCSMHQQSRDVDEAKHDIKALMARLDKISDDLRVSYVQTTVHYNDLSVLDGTIDALRQQVDGVYRNMLAIYKKR